MRPPYALAVARYGRADYSGIRQQLLDVFAEVYAAEAEVDPFFSLSRFADRLDRHASHGRWSCAVGEIGREVVGYAYGRPDSAEEWQSMTAAENPEVYRYGGNGDMFGLCEIMVRRSWRGAGIARTLHDELMRDRPEPRASLLVESDHVRVRETYERWGSRRVASSQPFPDSPLYEAMVLRLRPAPLPER